MQQKVQHATKSTCNKKYMEQKVHARKSTRNKKYMEQKVHATAPLRDTATFPRGQCFVWFGLQAVVLAPHTATATSPAGLNSRCSRILTPPYPERTAAVPTSDSPRSADVQVSLRPQLFSSQALVRRGLFVRVAIV